MTTIIERQAANLPIDWSSEYLDWLGLPPESPSFAALCRLIHAHMRAVPFENVTAILRRDAYPDRPVPEIEPVTMLRNWREGRGGGVCFEIASMFTILLHQLGYVSRPILGQISFAGGHQAVIVEFDGQPFLIDIGGASPIFAPVSLTEETEIHAAGLGFRFRVGETRDQWVQERLIDGVWTIHCRYDLRPIDEDLRRTAYQRHHTYGQTWVIDRLRLVRVGDETVLKVTETSRVLHTPDGKQETPITTREELVAAMRVDGGAPNIPVHEALAALARFEQSVGS